MCRIFGHKFDREALLDAYRAAKIAPVDLEGLIVTSVCMRCDRLTDATREVLKYAKRPSNYKRPQDWEKRFREKG